MKLYNANLSPNCLRVRAVALELGIDLEIIEVNVFQGGASTPEYKALNPNGKVPLLVDGEFVLWESRAICGYLASKRPEGGLQPSDPKGRAIVDQWSYWQAIHLGPPMQKVGFERVLKARFGMGEPDETVIAAAMKEVGQFLKVLDGALSGKEWVAGELSLADFALASTFMYRESAQIALDDTPSVAAWIERLESRDSWKGAVAPLLSGTLG